MKRLWVTVLAAALAALAQGCANNDVGDGVAPMGDRPNGSRCTTGHDCVSGVCNGGVCQGSAGASGRANGSACEMSVDCASGYCVMNRCEATPRSMDRPLGASCSAPSQCASGECVEGMCGAPPDLDAGPGDDAATDARTDARNDRADRVDGADDADTDVPTTDGGGGPTGGDPTMPPRVETRVNGEVCDNGVDDDGDGVVNEDCSCNPGARMDCYPGRPGEAGGTRCQWGTMTCLSGARWGECTGFGRPQMETCNGVDDNCDGQIDEECECPAEGMTRACYGGPEGSAGVGACRAGAQRCTRDMVGRLVWGECENMTVPDFESCNGVDDDCDNMTDEGCDCPLGETRTCYAGAEGTAGVGVCRRGAQRCLPRGDGGSTWGPCDGAVTPSASEACDGADDDCDGTVDENCSCTPGETRECYNGPAGTGGRGTCSPGRMTCGPDGRWGACMGERLPRAETCDMADDNCNGEVDETCLCPMGETPVYRRGAPMAAPQCGIQPGTMGPNMERSCVPMMRCPQGEAFVEVRAGVFQCTEGPPRCPAARFPNYYPASGWVCDRGCEVIVRYGGAFGTRAVCAQRPQESSCRGSCFHTFNPTLEAWECGQRCAGAMAGIRWSGLQLCLPCPDPPGIRIRPPD